MHVYGLCGVYIIECLATGRVYVGQSRNVGRRLDMHERALNKQRAEVHPLMQEEWNTYGGDRFHAGLVEECSEDELRTKEREWIGKFNLPDVYNTKEVVHFESGKQLKYPGVYKFRNNTWVARLKPFGRPRMHLGTFKTQEQAHEARLKAKKALGV